MTLSVVEEDETVFSEEMSAAVDSFKGSVAIKKAEKTWESVNTLQKFKRETRYSRWRSSYAVVNPQTAL